MRQTRMSLRRGGPLIVAVAVLVLVVGCGTSSGTDDSTSRSTTAGKREQVSLPDLVQRIKSGVVEIAVKGCGFKATGTGILIGSHQVVTVEHVIDAAKEIRIVRNGKTVARATVIGADGARDLALLRTSTGVTGYHLSISRKAPRLGDSVAVIGYPLNLPLSVTKGTVSGLSRTISINGVRRRSLIQTDAAVNPGNSGGPLLLLPSGEVVGLVDLGSRQVNGIAFAVSGKLAAALVEAWQAAPQPLRAAKCQSPAPQRAAPTGSQTGNEDRFQSPSGNIRCAYVNQTGVACMTLNDGLGAFLRSFDTSYALDQPYAFNPPAGRTLAYGQTWAVSSFRCYSGTDGMKCWSTVTGHGFFLSRDTRRIF